MSNCNFITKNNQPCKVKVSQKSNTYNGIKYCHIHSKKIPINLNSCQDTLQDNSKQIIYNIKSPPINYKINKNSDNCYVCLEETETKLSCGHFIHTNCILNILQSDIRKNYKVFEQSPSAQEVSTNQENPLAQEVSTNKKNYFIITNCLYCKQISIIKNVEIPESFNLNKKDKYDIKKSNNFLKMNNETLSYYFSEIFLKYDTYETKKELENSSTEGSVGPNSNQLEQEFIGELKDLIFDDFSSIIFDNYIQQKNKRRITSKYKKINKNKIMKKINQTINQTLYSIFLFNKIKNKIEVFFRILENIICKLINMENVQDDIINLLNVF